MPDNVNTGELTGQQFWNQRHEYVARECSTTGKPRFGGIRRMLNRARAEVGAEAGESYTEFLFEDALKRLLPRRSDWSVIEIGCAPGRHLLRLHRLLGYHPYGVEYSPAGAESARLTLAEGGRDPSCIIEADLFAASFQERYAAAFDVVFSGGLVEHFADPTGAITAHLHLLKPGGYLVCSIPNLRSLSYPVLRVFARDLLRSHNLAIMRLDKYRELFASIPNIQQVYCGFVGLLGLHGGSLRFSNSPSRIVGKCVDRLSDAISAISFLILRGRTLEGVWSPELLFVGRKSHGEAVSEPSSGFSDPSRTY